MEIHKKSYFKKAEQDKKWFEDWVAELEELNKKKYCRLQIETSLGSTCIWGLNLDCTDAEVLVIFPGARTTSLFWDLDNGLESLGEKYRIYLIETNGLPNLSSGSTPDIKHEGYGEWAKEIFDKLHIKSAYIAGASFGGLICMKLSIVASEKIKAAFLLNPGCLQPFSLSFKNLYYNLLPIFFPTKKNVRQFLDRAVFCKPEHCLTKKYEALIVSYELFALTCYKDNTQKPYYMNEELRKATVPVYLLEGDKDILFPYATSVKNAKEKLPGLKEVIVFKNVGHGIETYNKAIVEIGRLMKEHEMVTQ